MFRLRIYEVKSEYVEYLSKYQDHLFYDKNNSNKRKYIGIVLEINGYKYFAPLSSFKKKHNKIKEGVDFIKIKDYRQKNRILKNAQIVYSHKKNYGGSTLLAKRTNDFEKLEQLCDKYLKV